MMSRGTDDDAAGASYDSEVGALTRDFISWLELHSPIEERGQYSEIARHVGLHRTYVSKLMRGKRQGELTFETLEVVAAAKGIEPWEVLWCIAHGVLRPPPRHRTPPKQG